MVCVPLRSVGPVAWCSSSTDQWPMAQRTGTCSILRETRQTNSIMSAMMQLLLSLQRLYWFPKVGCMYGHFSHSLLVTNNARFWCQTVYKPWDLFIFLSFSLSKHFLSFFLFFYNAISGQQFFYESDIWFLLAKASRSLRGKRENHIVDNGDAKVYLVEYTFRNCQKHCSFDCFHRHSCKGMKHIFLISKCK